MRKMSFRSVLIMYALLSALRALMRRSSRIERPINHFSFHCAVPKAHMQCALYIQMLRNCCTSAAIGHIKIRSTRRRNHAHNGECELQMHSVSSANTLGDGVRCVWDNTHIICTCSDTGADAVVASCRAIVWLASNAELKRVRLPQVQSQYITMLCYSCRTRSSRTRLPAPKPLKYVH